MKKPGQPDRLILYADDDPDDRDFVKAAFSRYTHDVELRTFCCAIDLLQFIHDRKRDEPLPCLIILDINMPQVNGKDALILLRNMDKYGDVPVVLFSTSTMPNEHFFANFHKAAFFTKPLNEVQMNTIVKKFLAHCNDEVQK